MSKFLLRQRQRVGVLVHDVARYCRALRSPGSDYLALCNRGERLDPAPDGSGYRCDWAWTSDLHAPKVIAQLGRALMAKALAQHPVRFAPEPAAHAVPQISFLIGHRGLARVPLLLATLETIAAQEGPAVECIVIEQDSEQRLADRLPPWVRYIHTPPPSRDMPYCRSWSFNVGARAARSAVLVLHDNDMMVPADYAEQITRRVSQGYEAVNLKRFIFYLAERHTADVIARRGMLMGEPPEAVVQNLEAGGSIAISREAFDHIGGMDESFIGWGGEDNELWERVQVRKVWPYGHLPIVHLWHAAQPEKYRLGNIASQKLEAAARVPIPERIARLRARGHGSMTGPVRG